MTFWHFWTNIYLWHTVTRINFLSINLIWVFAIFALFEVKIWVLCTKFQIFHFLKSFNFSAKIQISNLASFHQNKFFWTKIAFCPSLHSTFTCYLFTTSSLDLESWYLFLVSIIISRISTGIWHQYISSHSLSRRNYFKCLIKISTMGTIRNVRNCCTAAHTIYKNIWCVKFCEVFEA